MEAEGSRLGHMVEHSFAMFGALLGMALGALAFGALAVATVATGGLLGAVLIGAAAAGGASLGGMIGKRYGQKAKKPTGPIIMPCSIDVLYENVPAAHTTSAVMCSGMPGTPAPHPAMLIAEGSSTVFINGMMAARKGSKATCSATIGEGCGSIIIGGDTATHPGLTIKPEFPEWLDTTINVLGLIGIVGIFTIGIVPGLIALAGGLAGGFIFSWIGTSFLGMEAGGDAHFWFSLAGGFIGGIAAARFGLGIRARMASAASARARTNLRNTVKNDADSLAKLPKDERGPVVARAYDTKTGRMSERYTNVDKVPEDLDPILMDRVNNLNSEGKPHFSEPGTHAEVLAVDEILQARRAAGEKVTPETLNEIIHDQYWLDPKLNKPNNGINPAPTCQNCTSILNGTESLGGNR